MMFLPSLTRASARRIFACLFVLAVAAAVAATPASAAKKRVSFVLNGAGWGHGIGMSQYGAHGMAQHGSNYSEIIKHYYKGVSIGQASTKTIRVLLRSGPSSVKFKGATRAGSQKLDPDATYTIKRSGGELRILKSNGDLVAKFSNSVDVSDDGPVQLLGTAIGGLSNGRYRGTLSFATSALGGMTVVNAVDLDDYVQGVIPAEMPSSWKKEALKAQAIAARSYALTTDAGGALFDQYPDTRSQVYRGVNAEVSSTNTATQETGGMVAKYNGKVIPTFFFSTSGGRTENIENSFYGAKAAPYLVSVEDPYDNISPKHRWTLKFTRATLQAKLGKSLVKGTLRRVKVVKRGVSPRIVQADIIGTRGTVRTTGATLRAKLGLNDTWVTFKRVTK
jgi:stage II sporulation protein D